MCVNCVRLNLKGGLPIYLSIFLSILSASHRSTTLATPEMNHVAILTKIDGFHLVNGLMNTTAKLLVFPFFPSEVILSQIGSDCGMTVSITCPTFTLCFRIVEKYQVSQKKKCTQAF